MYVSIDCIYLLLAELMCCMNYVKVAFIGCNSSLIKTHASTISLGSAVRMMFGEMFMI